MSDLMHMSHGRTPVPCRKTPAGLSSPNDAQGVRAFRDDAGYMATDSFHSELAELMEAVNGSVPAILRSETVPWRCRGRRN